jgi:hypothetical protein
MNFRIPRELKLQFQSACRTRDTFMTAELLRFIRAYLHAPHARLNQKKHASTATKTHPRIDPHTGFALSESTN